MLRYLAILTVLTVELALPALALADAPPVLLNPITCDDFLCLAAQIIRFLLGGIAVFATAMFIYGGFVFLTSGGNADQVKRGKETLFWATIGIMVVILSWIIVQFVLKNLVARSA
jgi:hypothetical protein